LLGLSAIGFVAAVAAVLFVILRELDRVDLEMQIRESE
jgi:hypothetical protein